MPLQRRLPKRGFRNIFRKRYAVVNLDDLAKLGESVITPELLLQKGVISKLLDGLKVLGDGELKIALTVTAHRFSQTAVEKITGAGGKAESERGAQRNADHRRIPVGVTENQADEDESVLDPLLRAQQLDERGHPAHCGK